MKEREDKYMNEFIDKVMRQATLDTTSVDFTSMVMGKVEAIKSSAATTYEPLISKRTWLLIFGVSIAFVFVLMWLGFKGDSRWSTILDFSFVNTIEFSKMFNYLQISNATSVSIMMFCLMLMIQIPLLKTYFDKRIGF